ncbi:MAG: lamin tail domain-containing protein, partial [Verrucomicrobiota bacterium]
MKFNSCLWICRAILVVWAGSASAQSQVLISEFMASNTRILADQDGDYSDWIEIHNSGSIPVNLADWYLTDSDTQLNKWKFPSVSLDANGYLVVFASGKDRAAAGAQLHANFSLAAQGEYLALVQPDGTTVASEFAPQYPEQLPDYSYGVVGGVNYYFAKPT